MSKKFAFIALISLIAAVSISAQKATEIDAKIENIRALYNETNRTISEIESNDENAKGGRFAVNELVINKLDRSWAAVGNYKVVYRFYYQNKEEEPYPTQLVKVTIAVESAARRYFYEFLYDGADQLVFFFERSTESEVPDELRVYFAKGTPIRIVENGSKRDKFTVNDLIKTNEALQESRRVRDIFVRSIEL